METLEQTIERKAKTNGEYAIAYALLKLADAQQSTAYQIRNLGNADAATPMGALEAFGLHIGEKLDALTLAIGDLDFSA